MLALSNPCGACTMCCRVLHIEELKKPAGDWCNACNIGKGCRIYEDRPEPCRTFECLYLQWATNEAATEPVHPDFRPDKCRIVFHEVADKKIISGNTDPNRPHAWQNEIVMAYINALCKMGFRVVIGTPQATERLLFEKHPFEPDAVTKRTVNIEELEG